MTTPLYGFSDTSFKTAGGETGIRQLVDDFYRFMDELPEAATIRAIALQAFATYLLAQLRIPAERIFTVSKKP